MDAPQHILGLPGAETGPGGRTVQYVGYRFLCSFQLAIQVTHAWHPLSQSSFPSFLQRIVLWVPAAWRDVG